MTALPKPIAAILAKCPGALRVVEFLESHAYAAAFDLGALASMPRALIASTLADYARRAVVLIEQVEGLTGDERRALIVWASRELVDFCYSRLPRGPVLFCLEKYLGGFIRKQIAAYIGECVSAWLDAFIELEVAKLRKATPA